MTSLMVEPTTIIFTPLVTFNSLNVLLPSLTSPMEKETKIHDSPPCYIVLMLTSRCNLE